MSLERLQRALADIGLPGTLEARGSLIILKLDADVSLEDDDVRDSAFRLASSHGFTHLALELPNDNGDGAPLYRH
ncbi:MAG TPA: hypothetical protein VJ803_01345 [Gemmatimonadaceae bacterium]|nr:hypothetical protein [Gemmatimonadaceae bacterium]